MVDKRTSEEWDAIWQKYPPRPANRSKVNEDWFIDGQEIFHAHIVRSQYNECLEFVTEGAPFRIYMETIMQMVNEFYFKAVITKRRKYAHLEEAVPKSSLKPKEEKEIGEKISIRRVKQKLLKSIGR